MFAYRIDDPPRVVALNAVAAVFDEHMAGAGDTPLTMRSAESRPARADPRFDGPTA